MLATWRGISIESELHGGHLCQRHGDQDAANAGDHSAVYQGGGTAVQPCNLKCKGSDLPRSLECKPKVIDGTLIDVALTQTLINGVIE